MGRRPKTSLYGADGRLQQKHSPEPGETLEFTTILGAELTRVDISIRECKNGLALKELVARNRARHYSTQVVTRRSPTLPGHFDCSSCPIIWINIPNQNSIFVESKYMFPVAGHRDGVNVRNIKDADQALGGEIE